jgi:uncharacterized protein (DUF983 family)
MVKLAYCPECEKAYRFHLKKRLVCPNCRETYETIDVPRTKYFLIQFPFVFVGFIIIIFSVFNMLIEQERLVEPFGLFILGFALLLFALALQFTDNAKMEQQGSELGKQRYATKTEKDRVTGERFKPASVSIGMSVDEANSKYEQTKLDQLEQKDDGSVSISQLFVKPNKPVIEKEDKSVSASQLFSRPNKAGRIMRIPKQDTQQTQTQMQSQTPIQTSQKVKISSIIKPQDGKKKARKIRKAI